MSSNAVPATALIRSSQTRARRAAVRRTGLTRSLCLAHVLGLGTGVANDG